MRCKGLKQSDGGVRKMSRIAATHDQGTGYSVGAKQRDDEKRTIAGAENHVTESRRWFVPEICDLNRFATASRCTDINFVQSEMLLSDRLDQRFSHAMGGPQPELLAQVAEDVDRASIRS